MRHRLWITVLLLIGSLASSTALRAQRADKAVSLLEAATQAQLVDGNLDQAVRIYQQILAAFSAERPTAAAALLGLARCYEQLGDARSRQTYERVISQYADQTREVGVARERLSGMASGESRDPSSEVVVREVWSRPAPMVSPNGANSNFVIFSDLAVHNRNTAETKRLISGARSAAYPVLSPDRRQVAYVSWSGDLQASMSQAGGDRSPLPARVELRVVGIDGSKDRAVMSTRKMPWLRPLAWAPDGEQILTAFERPDGTHEISFVSTIDGSTRVLKSLEASSPKEVGISDDGSYIAYTLPTHRDSRRVDVFMVPVDNQRGRSRLERRYSLMLGAEPPVSPSSRQEAIHVLNRISFGPRPGDVERVGAMGVNAYIEQQLYPERIADPMVDAKLAGFTSLRMGLQELLELGGPVTPQGLRSRASIFEKRAMADRAAQNRRLVGEDNTVMPTTDRNRRILHDKHPEPDEIHRARALRALHSERQLFELVVDFWMNHFSIRLGDHQHVPHFEEAVIRRYSLGKFEDFLMAVAKHPRMLNYLDNWRSSAPADVIQQRIATLKAASDEQQYLALLARKPFLDQAKGLNENYARELMELHTLGIDGGYSQQDVIEVAKVMTGWTISGEGIVNGREDDGVFKFDPLLHVDGPKTVLGQTIKPGGVDEGEQVIRILARHASTARFISTKLARRFIADDPPAAVIDAASRTFLQTGGDIREVLRTILTSVEFRSNDAYRAKIKKPFELVISALRAVKAEIVSDTFYNRVVTNPQRSLVAQMGERLYSYEAPDGNPDTGAAWMNSNALLVRLDFANSLATGRLPGVQIDLAAGQQLLEQLGMPKPTPQQIQQTRAMLEASAARARLSAPKEDSMMMMGGGRSGPVDRTSDIDPAAIVVATMLGSPQFQKR